MLVIGGNTSRRTYPYLQPHSGIFNETRNNRITTVSLQSGYIAVRLLAISQIEKSLEGKPIQQRHGIKRECDEAAIALIPKFKFEESLKSWEEMMEKDSG